MHIQRRIPILASVILFATAIWQSNTAVAGDHIWVPVRWCGVEGALSMENPSVVGESSSDDVLWRRHERPTDAIYIPFVNMTFRAGSTADIKNGPQSFPIIRDVSGTGGDLIDGEPADAITMCRRAWMMGDPLYFDQNNNNAINAGTDTLLSTDMPMVGFADLGHDGATLNAVPSDVKYVDADSSAAFEIGETIYRDENNDGLVDTGDTLLVDTLGTTVGDINPGDVGAPLLAVPAEVKYLDLIRRPPNTYNIGYPAVQGVTAVNANDVEITGVEFPVHGIAAPGIGGLGAVMDDASQYLPPGPDFTLFETQLVGHEFGHAFTLLHGDGIDDDMDGALDDGDDPRAFPAAGPGTLCDSNNVMSYCWLDNGTSGNPNLEFIGVDPPTNGNFTPAQSDKIRNFVLANVSDRIVDPITAPLVAGRVDNLGELDERFAHLDVADFSVRIDSTRQTVAFSLTTRRPFPKNWNRVSQIYYIIDIDNDEETGGKPASIGDGSIPTDFVGAEYVGIVRLNGLEVESATLLEYVATDDAFIPVISDAIRARRTTLEAIPDFPMGRKAPDPDGPAIGPVSNIPIREMITLSVPNALVAIPTAANFRIEYLTHDVGSGTSDRARTPGMNFDLPVFPNCRAEPPSVPQGGSTVVTSTGLLPSHDVHMLLGETELANGTTDTNGSVTMTLPIPADARTGLRLVTVGGLAVSADCLVTVEGRRKPPGGLPERIVKCCKTISLQLWIIIALLVVVAIWLIFKKR
jgi:hypothetical protein